jgi:uncharacterized protein (TIGR04222 family)
MPNPFDLPGPEFLVFYLVLGAVVTAAIVLLRRRSETAAETTVPLTDYLKIAYLRGGADEALRVAAVALMDRGLVEVVDGSHLQAKPANPPAGLQRTEQRLLESCKIPTRASAIADDTSLQITVRAECEGQLVRAGLLPDNNVKADRQWLLFGGASVLVVVALVKILVALSRGRTNIGFLIIVALVFAYVLFRAASPFRTQAGEAMLADLRQLFRALRSRPSSLSAPSGTNELALLAAVFGIGALPSGRGYVAEKLFRKPQKASSASCGSGGSSCGSSCGGGGSSCGGGCGGGCGGCGS